MIIESFVVGPLYTNCYLVACPITKEAIIIDPGFHRRAEYEAIVKRAVELGLKVVLIVNTHGHPDHTSGNSLLQERLHVPIAIHERDVPLLTKVRADVLLRDGDTIKFGATTLRVLHTPGHTMGSISLIGRNEVFTGDTLFAGSVGRWDLPGGSFVDLMRSLRERLMILPDSFVVYPGHGPTSTIGGERASNPFLTSKFDYSFIDFIT